MMPYGFVKSQWIDLWELEQLESLRSEDTPGRLMITHIIESYWIPSQKKTKFFNTETNFTCNTPSEVAW